MKILAIETASRYGSVALLDGTRLLAERLSLDGINHCEHLQPTISAMLELACWRALDLDAFAVVRGPGSFTGLRIGLATVAGLAMATGRPVVGASSLQTLALGLPWCQYPICPVLDARKGEVYTALYQWQGSRLQCLIPDQVIPAARFAEQLSGTVVLAGDGRAVMAQALLARPQATPLLPPEGCSILRASVLGAWAYAELLERPLGDPCALLPLYLRSSESVLTPPRGGFPVSVPDGEGEAHNPLYDPSLLIHNP